MTIQDLGSLGELVAAIATVATLVYLAIQIKQNTISSRALTFQSASEFSTRFVESLYRDSELALLFEKGREDLKTLSYVERVRFNYVMLGYLRVCQVQHHQFEQGLMSFDIWSGYRESIRRWLDQPGSRQWWAENAERFSISFRRFLGHELDRPGSYRKG